MRLSLTCQPARRAILAARRHPQRGRSVENRRSQARSSASAVVIGGGVRRIVDRCRPTAAHARRCGTPNRSRSASTALRLRFGVRCSRGNLPEHVDVEGLVGD